MEDETRMLYEDFPPDFLWSSATAAYQVEGGWDADGNLSLTLFYNNFLYFYIFFVHKSAPFLT